MRITKIKMAALIIVLSISSGFKLNSRPTGYHGAYFGQKPPGLTPEIFAQKILSKKQPEWAYDCVFSPCGREFYYTVSDLEKKTDQIMSMRMVGNVWTEPEPVSFNSDHVSNNLCISHDGYRIFFKSWRPLPGKIDPEFTSYIWNVRRYNTGWSEAEPVIYDGEYLPAGHPSISSDGTLFFRYRGENDKGNADTYMSEFVNGSYSFPVSLGSVLNTEYIEGDVCVAADKSFIIVAGWDRPENSGESDLYISFREKDGTWSALRNMGEPVNTIYNENNAMLSPDEKYIFFMRVHVSNDVASCDTYWVDAKIIETFRPVDSK